MSCELFKFRKSKVYKKLLLRIIFFGLLITVSELITLDSKLIYAQGDYLEVKGDTRTDTLTFSGDRADFPSTPVRGEIFYNSQASNKGTYYYDGTTPDLWEAFTGGGPGTGGDRYVATQIVAASNSLDISRADWTCDGVNDEVTINNAIQALPSGGGAVYLLEGTYNISGSITFSASNDSGKALIGAGKGTVLMRSSNSAIIIYARNVSNILISQLSIEGDKATGTSSNRGIFWYFVTNSKIDKVWVRGMGWIGIELNSDNNNNTISNCRVWENGCHGIAIWGNSNNNIIIGNDASSNDDKGIYLSTSANNIVTSNIVWSNSSRGIDVGHLMGGNANNIISNNNVQANYSYGISIGPFAYYNVTIGNNVQSNLCGIMVDRSYSNVFAGNNIQGNTREGIYNSASNNTDNIFLGNTIYDNGGTGNFDGIRIDRDVDTNLISSNILYDSEGTGYPISIGPSDTAPTYISENNYLVGNLVSSWPTGYGIINDLGTNTKYTDKVKMTLQQWTISTGSSFSLDVATNPRSYVYVIPSSNITLTLINGKSAGDLLIIGNGKVSGAARTITINEASNVNLGANPRILDANDTLKLIWNGSVAEGGTGKWLEMYYAANN